MPNAVAIVSSNGPANVGDLLLISFPIGTLEGKEGFAAVGETCQRAGATIDRRLMAFYRRVLAEFGDICVRATAHTVAS